MPTRNPDYDPKALELQEKFGNSIRRHTTLLRKSHTPDGLTTAEQAEFAVLHAKNAADLDAFQATFYRSHPTIQEYAKWLITGTLTLPRSFPVDLSEIDYEAITTKEGAIHLWAHFSDVAKRYQSHQTPGLPLGQPKDLVAFSNEDRVLYAPKSVSLGTLAGEGKVRTQTILDIVDDVAHICLAYEDQKGPSVVNHIEQIATIFYHSFRDKFVPPDAEPLLPKDFKFYIYIPQQYASESFMAVPMYFRDGRYQSADFQHFDSVPASVRKISNMLMDEDLNKLRSQIRGAEPT